MGKKLKIISGSSHKPFAQQVCAILDTELTETETIRFSNDNMMVKIKQNIREQDVFLIQTSVKPVSDNIFEMFLLLDALKHASAARITAVVPYLPYVRSDKKDQPRISIAARLMADLMESAGADRALTMDLHSSQIQGFFRIPCDQLFAAKILCQHIKQNFDLTDYVLVAADIGESKHLGFYANLLNLPIAIIDKRRQGNHDDVVPTTLIGNVAGKHALIIDDEISTGKTLFKASAFLKEHDAKSVKAAIVHPILCGDALKGLWMSELDQLIVTDSIPLSPEGRTQSKITQLSVAPLFADAIARIHDGRSISDLY